MKQRFGGKIRIIQQHFWALREVPPVTCSLDTRGLRKLYGTVQLNVRCLNVLDVPTNSSLAMSYDVMLQSLLQPIVIAFYSHRRLQDEVHGMQALPSGEAVITSCKNLEQLLRYTLETRDQCGSSASSTKGLGSHCKHAPSSAVLNALDESNVALNECSFCKSAEHETEACSATTMIISEKKRRLAKFM